MTNITILTLITFSFFCASLISTYLPLDFLEDTKIALIVGIVSLITFVIVIITYNVTRKIKSKKEIQKRNNYFSKYNKQNGYSKVPNENLLDIGSYSNGIKNYAICGKLTKSRNSFAFYYQREKKGDEEGLWIELKRTVLQINIPNIKTHFILNSKLNNGYTGGGNLEKYLNYQKFDTSESIYKYVDILTPSDDEINLLVILTPNAIAYILKEFINADIEIIDDQLYIYYYKTLKPEDVVSILEKVDELIKKMKLREEDTRTSQEIMNHEVSRIAINKKNNKRLISISNNIILVFVAILLTVYIVGPLYLQPYISIFIILVMLFYVYTLLKTQILKSRIKQEISAYY